MVIHVAMRASAAMAPITMPAIAPPDREALREAGAVAMAVAEGEVEARAEEGADAAVVVAKLELGFVEEGDVARGVAGYSMVE